MNFVYLWGYFMRLKIVACGVFEPYLKKLVTNTNDIVDLVILDAGLHERPNELRISLQKEIDVASEQKKAGHNAGDCRNCPNPCKAYDYIILFYGLCGRGTVDLVTRNIPIIIPKVHDCISLFLGSNEAYRKEFNKNPGTFYHTLGWIKNKINPKNKDGSQLYINYYDKGWKLHPEYDELENKYGEENAEFILKFSSAWQKNYNRSVYIDLGFDNESAYSETTKFMAKVFNWEYEKIHGDIEYIRSLFSADITDKVVVIPPYSITRHSGDEKIFSYVSDNKDIEESIYFEEEKILESVDRRLEISGIGLGIDAGGTYTDVVIYDFTSKKVLAKAKSPTTYSDLLIGINKAISMLPSDLLKLVKVSSLSTTLATNSIVEGRGYKVGLISYSPFDWFDDSINHSPSVKVKGAVNISGEIIDEIDKEEVIAATKKLVFEDACSAIAIGGYGSIRNPKLSQEIKKLVKSVCPDISIVCSHELSQRLNAINSVRTAIANARLIPVIQNLVIAVKKALISFGIFSKLVIVKGDGTCVNTDFALERPVETIMSGPAASVSGAKILTQAANAIVIDVGGTTTDTAVIRNGYVEVSDEGAIVGDWTIHIDSAKISTTGLGGDSRIDFNRDRVITLGPMRNLPLCFCVSSYPFLGDRLKEIASQKLQGAYDASGLDILVYDNNINNVFLLNENEARLVELLKSEGAMFARDAYQRLGLASMELLHIPKLETMGVLKRSALTPTDILHINGKFNTWNGEASELGLNIFSRLYGESEKYIIERVEQTINKRLLKEILKRQLNDEGLYIKNDVSKEMDFFLDKIVRKDFSGIGFKLTVDSPIIAIGAPAREMFESFDDYISTTVIIPEHADVANAVGAVSGEIVIKETVTIRHGLSSNYVVFSNEERFEDTSFEVATQKAVMLAKANAIKKADLAGAINPSMIISVKDHVAKGADGSVLFIERFVYSKITANAVG